MSATLTDAQETMLREAADNGGEIWIYDADPGDKKTATQLVRTGMFTCGTPRGAGWHHVTGHGLDWLAANKQENPR